MTHALIAALAPLAAIANAYDNGTLDGARKVTVPLHEVEIYQGRGGNQLLTLQDAFAARKAVATKTGCDDAIKPLVAIANAFDDNGLDDEGRKFWGINDENTFDRDPKDVPLVHCSGGGVLLNLAQALAAREAA